MGWGRGSLLARDSSGRESKERSPSQGIRGMDPERARRGLVLPLVKTPGRSSPQGRGYTRRSSWRPHGAFFRSER